MTPPLLPGEDSIAALARDRGSLLGVLQSRVLHHMPSVGAAAAVGINPRWRSFRYGEGGVYRPHIDGSWTCAGEREGGQYTNDVRGDRRSKFTFLMYLNDDFEGGATTFYMPGSGGDGGLVKLGVKPIKGGALVFPQGNIASLVHEGSKVDRGVKYVVRTDVIYTDTTTTKTTKTT